MQNLINELKNHQTNLDDEGLSVAVSTNVDWTEVDSSNIQALRYVNGEMEIKFHSGAVYVYENVPKKVFHEIMNAASVGRTFNQQVKSQPSVYPFRRVL